jgi:hypothetical protein
MDQDESNKSSDAENRRTNSRRSLIAEFSSVAALVVSFAALSIGAIQTRLMQSQARAGVWPYVSIGYSIDDQGAKHGFTWEVDNDGVGPARIESVIVSLDGKPVRSWNEVLHALFGDTPVSFSINEINGKVLPPNTNRETTIEALRVADLDQAKVLHAARDRVAMTICYCSVYDECWIANRMEHKVRPVDRCETAGTVQFEQ